MTPGLASAIGVVEGIRQLQRYFTTGDQGRLDDAREILRAAANNSAASEISIRGGLHLTWWTSAMTLDPRQFGRFSL